MTSARAHVTPRPAHDARVTHGGLPGPRRARGVRRGRPRFRWRLPGRPGRALTRPGRGIRPRRRPSAAPRAPRPRSPRPRAAGRILRSSGPGSAPPRPWRRPGGCTARSEPAPGTPADADPRAPHARSRWCRPPGAPCTVPLVAGGLEEPVGWQEGQQPEASGKPGTVGLRAGVQCLACICQLWGPGQTAEGV
ncbi:hypothetical protein VULLAG_LOCUS22673 [Vulpes lagopus]